jgi:hypothetical protein
MKEREHDMRDAFTLRPFYLKAINTLREQVKCEFSLPHLYHSYLINYQEVRLIKCIQY